MRLEEVCQRSLDCSITLEDLNLSYPRVSIVSLAASYGQPHLKRVKPLLTLSIVMPYRWQMQELAICRSTLSNRAVAGLVGFVILMECVRYFVTEIDSI